MLSVIDVTTRLPEVMHIQDDDIRNETIGAIQHFPDYFWEVPASSSKKYHNPYGRMQHGLWIHVKMAYSALNRVLDSYIQQGLMTEYGADCARSAILLHDMFKQGMPEDRFALPPEERHTVPEHDMLAADWLAVNTALPQEVLFAVEAHNGPWYEGRSPVEIGDPRSRAFHICQAVHVADMMASTPDGTFGVYKPTRKLADKYPTLPRAILL